MRLFSSIRPVVQVGTVLGERQVGAPRSQRRASCAALSNPSASRPPTGLTATKDDSGHSGAMIRPARATSARIWADRAASGRCGRRFDGCRRAASNGRADTPGGDGVDSMLCADPKGDAGPTRPDGEGEDGGPEQTDRDADRDRSDHGVDRCVDERRRHEPLEQSESGEVGDDAASGHSGARRNCRNRSEGGTPEPPVKGGSGAQPGEDSDEHGAGIGDLGGDPPACQRQPTPRGR